MTLETADFRRWFYRFIRTSLTKSCRSYESWHGPRCKINTTWFPVLSIIELRYIGKLSRLREMGRMMPRPWKKQTLVSLWQVQSCVQHYIPWKASIFTLTIKITREVVPLKSEFRLCLQGIAGTEVAKEASDIIITDDNFINVVKVQTRGYGIYLRFFTTVVIR